MGNPGTSLPVTAALLLACVPAASQNPPREDYVFHVYVDPTFGDDFEADRLNPSWLTADQPFSFHPDTSVIVQQDRVDFRTSAHIGGLLAHAPYSFRTIEAAIQYLCTKGPNSGQQQGQDGWMLGAEVLPGKRIAWIVIHCLPGLYGDPSSGPVVDPESGLRWNGERFPIELPYGLSLQGTSALDTIIDARNDPHGFRSHAISIVEPGAVSVAGRTYIANNPLRAVDPNGQPTHAVADTAQTFVDGFTIRGAAVLENPSVPFSGRYVAGAGVFMRRRIGIGWNWDEGDPAALALAPTISNCFVNRCGVGVGVVALQEFSVVRTWRPRIVNCTFADNVYVDVYNGSTDPSFNNPSTGLNQLRVVNNICLQTLGVTPPATGRPFEGMHEADLRVAAPAAPFCFNAYAATPPNSVPNQGVGWTNEWPASLVDPGRAGVPAIPAPLPPVVNLVLLSSDALFVNRVLSQTRGPISPHDYRLAPWSLAVFDPVADPTGMRNPMVDVGVALPAPTMTITFANGLVINETTQPAGLPLAAVDAAEPFQLFHAWDDDCEGFANPRVFLRPGFPTNGFGGIDLGADECGRLVMSGFLDDTRMFARVLPPSSGAIPPPPAVLPVISRPQVFFFDLASQGPYPRPSFNAVFGGYHWAGRTTDWFLNAQSNPTPNPATNYCRGEMNVFDAVGNSGIFGSWRSGMLTLLPPSPLQKLQRATGIRMLVMRNFRCDFSPLLPPDIHPAWSDFGDFVAPGSGSGCASPPSLPNNVNPPIFPILPWDLYAANPWYADDLNYQHQRQPADLSDPATFDLCDRTIAVDNPFAYYNPAPGFPGTAGQVPSRLSNVTSGHLNPPGTFLDMSGGQPVAPRLLLDFGVQRFGPFTPCVDLGSANYDVDQWGVGDVSTGCPDEVPAIWQGVGIRVNCMLGVDPQTGVGTSNLQTFLVYSRTQSFAGTGQISASMPVQSTGAQMQPATEEQLRAVVRDLLQPRSARR